MFDDTATNTSTNTSTTTTNPNFSLSLAGQTALITGVAGFLGSHLAEQLLLAGASVIGVDNFISGSMANVEFLKQVSETTTTTPNTTQFEFIQADASRPLDDQLSHLTQLDLVFHFSSPASPPLYTKYPQETYLVNSIGTHHLLSFVKNKFPKAQIVFASTSEVYGNPLEHPQKESYWGNVNPNGLRSCYDESKRLGETICGVFTRNFDLDIRIVRVFNTYGPKMSLDDGRVITNFIKAKIENQVYPIYGDGTQTRAYCYVDDLIRGILSLATLPGLSGLTCNLGNPTELTILETALAVELAFDPNQTTTIDQLKVNWLPLPEDDPAQRNPDITLAKETLGWQPLVSLEQGLQKTIEFFRLLAK